MLTAMSLFAIYILAALTLSVVVLGELWEEARHMFYQDLPLLLIITFCICLLWPWFLLKSLFPKGKANVRKNQDNS
jgi:membrane protease YdiL (CAAX protease family)